MALKKEGKMERREKWQLWQKWQPAAQATGTSEMENNKKRVTTMKNHNFNLIVWKSLIF